MKPDSGHECKAGRAHLHRRSLFDHRRRPRGLVAPVSLAAWLIPAPFRYLHRSVGSAFSSRDGAPKIELASSRLRLHAPACSAPPSLNPFGEPTVPRTNMVLRLRRPTSTCWPARWRWRRRLLDQPVPPRPDSNDEHLAGADSLRQNERLMLVGPCAISFRHSGACLAGNAFLE